MCRLVIGMDDKNYAIYVSMQGTDDDKRDVIRNMLRDADKHGFIGVSATLLLNGQIKFAGPKEAIETLLILVGN